MFNVATEAIPGDCPPHGVVALLGRRREMEDAISVVPSLFSIHPAKSDEFSSCQHHFFGVYDGHGGSEVADFCKARFHSAIIEEVTAIVEEVTGCIGNVELEYRNGHLDASQWRKVMVSSFLKVDHEISGSCPQDNCSIHKNESECQKPLGADSVGSTAIIGVVNDNQIIIANCGDCRAVLSRGGRAFPMSIDHKPDREDEMARVEAAGGRVVFWNGYRILGMLAMSRALGDRFLKPYVIPDPEVTCVERTVDDDFLVLASDGLWDVLSNDAVCQVIKMCLEGKTHHQVLTKGRTESRVSFAAAFLTKLAMSRGSRDNISVVIIDLRSPANGADAVTCETGKETSMIL